jgi:hypothetical protein
MKADMIQKIKDDHQQTRCGRIGKVNKKYVKKNPETHDTCVIKDQEHPNVPVIP